MNCGIGIVAVGAAGHVTGARTTEIRDRRVAIAISVRVLKRSGLGGRRAAGEEIRAQEIVISAADSGVGIRIGATFTVDWTGGKDVIGDVEDIERVGRAIAVRVTANR